ncbi:MAG TPA: hypothetical protein VGX25_26060 [Actinophytocola sp.]|uniref:hypothetical protein n=1 Tax=Actinophytocola sp. TaxID=1872138 RepID=UPI002DDCE3EC|nr:hypothetical protein [Actinophytocola sp.]HEV2782869.1 hypothetical protein [Actinophytocola sp.]
MDNSVIHPPYVDFAVELINRFLVRPAEIAEVLRYAEYLAVSEPNRIDATVADAFGKQVRPVAAKLLADVCGYLVTTAGLRPDFRAAARHRLVIDLTGGNTTNLNGQAATSPANPAAKRESPADQRHDTPPNHQMTLDEQGEATTTDPD